MQDKAQDTHSEPKTIPDKLPGTVQPQYVRCGKPNCKCAQGELHGPYCYRIWRDEGGKQHKEYVRRSDLEHVRPHVMHGSRNSARLRQYWREAARH